jgi:hypothetical protein
MKKSFSALLSTLFSTLGLVMGLTAGADISYAGTAIEYRRTLFVPIGQRTLVLEAPLEMCFLDPTEGMEEKIYNRYKRMAEATHQQILIGVFANCLDVSRMKTGTSPNDIALSGSVTWLNPAVGEATSLERPDYLDMREATFKEYAEKIFVKTENSRTTLDKQLHRDAYGVSLGYVIDTTIDYEKRKYAGVFATTSVKHIPIEINIVSTKTKGMPEVDLQRLIDKMLQQQIALNTPL